MKLRCNQHGTRVLVIDGKSFHRSSGEACTSRVNIGNFNGPASFVTLFVPNAPLSEGVQGQRDASNRRMIEHDLDMLADESAWDMHVRSIPDFME